MVPILGCSLGSTTSVRDVPSASGWPGHSAADAVRAVTQAAMPRHVLRHKAAHGRFRTPTTTLAIIEPRLHSISAVISTCSAMNAALMVQIPHLFRNFCACGDGFGGGRNQMDHAVMVVAQIAQESRQHG